MGFDRFKQSTSAAAATVSSPVSQMAAKIRFSQLMLRDQLLALLLTPFFLVAAIGFAKVIHEVILEFLPDAVASIQAVIFLSGTTLVIGTLTATFFWVKTGGFGLFAN